MKSNSTVRRPSLVDSGNGSSSDSKSVGETLRKAKRDLFFRRCLVGIFLVLVITFVAALFILGYVSDFIDFIIAWVE